MEDKEIISGLKRFQSLQQVFADMDARRKERFASAFDEEYPDTAAWVRKNGIPKQVMIPEGYIANTEALQPLIKCFEQWGISVVKTTLIRDARIFFISHQQSKNEIDLS